MKLKDDYKIYFSSLKEGLNEYTYQIKDSFFNDFVQEVEFSGCNINLILQLNKKSTFIELLYLIEGTVTLECDVTLELFEHEIKTRHSIILKFGEEFNDDDESILELPRNKNDFDISKYLYETILLALPVKKLHPKLENGELKSKILEKLESYKIEEINIPVEENFEIDSRWEKLKNI